MRSTMLEILLALVIAIGGCSSGTNSFSGGPGSETYSHIGDEYLDQQVSITDIVWDNKGAVPKVRVKVRNNTHRRMVIELKMDFYGEDGRLLDNPWGWKPLTLEEDLDDWVEYTAPNSDAKNCRLDVQRADHE